MDKTPEGSRKVVLTKWMLIILALGTLGYFILLGISEAAPPDSFFMNFVLGLGAIGGAFAIGNIFEHKHKAAQQIEKEKNTDNAVKRSENEKEKALAEAEKLKSEKPS